MGENREGWQEQKALAEHTVPVILPTLVGDNGCPIECREPKAFLLEQRHRIDIGLDNPHTVHPLDDEEREIDLPRQEAVIRGKRIFMMVVVPL